MKTRIFLLLLISVGIMVSCKKDNSLDTTILPEISTKELSNITKTTLTTGGSIIITDRSTITEQGICYSGLIDPTTSDSIIIDNSGLNDFESNISNLTDGKTYYIRAYAKNSAGTSYGQTVVFGNIRQSLSMGGNYLNDIYYSFTNGIVGTAPRANWDIAFSVSKQSSSIIINESAGVVLKKFTNTWSWENLIDTTGYKSWTALHNSNTLWEDGAFNQATTGGLNYGWGDYNTTSHNIIGVTKYIIKLRDGSFKKIFIELKQSSLQKYTFRFANIDGTSPVVIPELSAVGAKSNYIYYSLTENKEVVNREPETATWDIVFTQWLNSSIGYYPVTGAIQNIGISTIALTVSDPSNIVYNDVDFSTNINTIGSGWKSYSGGVYTIPTNKYYIVKDKTGKVFQLNFLSFEGGSTGNLSFNYKRIK